MQSDLISKNTKEFKSILYELTREVMNKEFPIENYFQIIESLYKVSFSYLGQFNRYSQLFNRCIMANRMCIRKKI
jgi:hypothetical protein